VTLPANIQIEPFFSEQDPLQSHSLQFMPWLVRKMVKNDNRRLAAAGMAEYTASHDAI
jgi:hypothetical protein